MIKVGTLAKIRRLYFRDKQSIKEICRQTGMARNTFRSWLRDPEMVEPKYPVSVQILAASRWHCRHADNPFFHMRTRDRWV